MNITVIIPKPLQTACEGRSKIELGLPASADVAEILHTLLSLYPGLRSFLANEKSASKQHFGVAQVGHTVFIFSQGAARPS
jgi:hypothetical protein